MARYVIGSVASMPAGSRNRVEVGGRAIAIFNIEGRFFALRDVCPHQGAYLSAGKIVGSVSASAPGCYEYDATRKLVKCPWHGWEFDVATGQSWFDPEKQRVRPYPVSVEPGERVAVTAVPPAAGTRSMPGPFVAETIPISVEDDYVVVEV
jgi:nitrite reductase/ring-hydroxylating ferredoxin subunit